MVICLTQSFSLFQEKEEPKEFSHGVSSEKPKASDGLRFAAGKVVDLWANPSLCHGY